MHRRIEIGWQLHRCRSWKTGKLGQCQNDAYIFVVQICFATPALFRCWNDITVRGGSGWISVILKLSEKRKSVPKKLQRMSKTQFEHATNVKTQSETFVFKHLCIHTAKRMVQCRIPQKYQVHSVPSQTKRCWRSSCSDSESHRNSGSSSSFQNCQISNHWKNWRLPCLLVCKNCFWPCGHLLAYNHGQVKETDFHTFHTKMYQAIVCKGPPAYRGVGDHRQCTGELPELEECDHEETHDDGGEGGEFNEYIPRPSKNSRVSRPHTAFQQECKIFLVKWGNHPGCASDNIPCPHSRIVLGDFQKALVYCVDCSSMHDHALLCCVSTVSLLLW